ncbi:MAG: 1-acyl-sn-glycerol-3-phosphate acyltransferase [Rhodospirillaceae bacterium]|nr:1-acyl-sn-glycerol-3-phosphate acyltransferase [Rhodospirillaceae bacterium]
MKGSVLRAIWRAVAYFALSLALIWIQALAVLFNHPIAARLPVIYHRWCCRILGFTIETRGQMSAERPTLFVANHTSYTDMTILGALIEGSFVGKREIASWPWFGILAKLQRTVFVDRTRRLAAGTQRDEMSVRLLGGENLILFPEGTSHDGTHILPFKSALLAVAEREVSGRKIAVQPVTIAYRLLGGVPLGRIGRAMVAWYGDMGLAAHLMRLLGLGRLTISVAFHAPITIDAFGSRKALAEHCRQVIADGLALALSGREAVPGPGLTPAPQP